MSSLTSVQLQQSAYFIPAVTQRVTSGGATSLDRPRPVTTSRSVVNDMAAIDPEGVVTSSESQGWQNLRAFEMRYSLSKWSMPAIENHCITVHLGPAVDVSARLGEQTFERRLCPGDIVIVPAGQQLEWSQPENVKSQALHLYLHPAFLRATAESIDFDPSQIVIAPQFGIRDEHLHHISLSLLHELGEANILGGVYADSLAKVLAMQLVRRYSYLKGLNNHGGMAPRKLRRAVDFINENLDKEQTVALSAVAQEVQMSYFHFSRVFKQSTGVSPNAYINEQRIDRAKRLLTETDLPISEIALRTGFASQSHFTTTFRKLTWTTPKAFREGL